MSVASRMSRWIVLGLLVYVSAGAARASEPAASEQLVRSYYEQLAAGDYGAYADVVHPDEAARFKGMLIEVFRMAEEEGDRGLMDATFGPEATLEDAEKSTPTEFIRAFMRLASAMIGGVEFLGVEVLGSVPEGELRHVVVRTRMKAEGIEITQMEVVSTKPYQGEPRLMLTGNWEGLGTAMRARAERRRAESPTPQ